jgi:hypothetical protein
MADRKSSGSGFRNPHNLPFKHCVVCQRPFTWRKKWAASWEQVRYCSEACRKSAGAGQSTR